jgi:hypothetical protein
MPDVRARTGLKLSAIADARLTGEGLADALSEREAPAEQFERFGLS